MKVGSKDISKIYLGSKEINKIYLGSKEIFNLEVSPNGSPSGLTATVLSDTSIKLDWTIGSTNQDGHKIYVSTNGTDFIFLDSVLGTTATYNATELVQGTTYYFKVAAYKGEKLSEYSNTSNATTTLADPTALTSQFIVDTILGQLSWTDNSGGVSQYEIYSNTNSGGDVLIATTAIGATSYSDTLCKQNASVVYKVRAKKGSIYSNYATASALVTPLCFKTNQTTLTTLTFNVLNITATKTVRVDWGDGTYDDYTGSSARTKNYTVTGNYNVSISGDVNFITRLEHNSQPTSSGNLSNWILPSSCTRLSLLGCSFTGNLLNWIIPSTMTVLLLYTNKFTGKTPNLSTGSSGMDFRMYSNLLTGNNTTIFRAGMTVFDIKTQNTAFPTTEIDKLYKAAADYYQTIPPTANCTYNTSGSNMGVPTEGALNADIVRLKGCYTSAGFTATVILT